MTGADGQRIACIRNAIAGASLRVKPPIRAYACIGGICSPPPRSMHNMPMLANCVRSSPQVPGIGVFAALAMEVRHALVATLAMAALCGLAVAQDTPSAEDPTPPAAPENRGSSDEPRVDGDKTKPEDKKDAKPKEWGVSDGPYTYGFYTGVVLSQSRDDFSEQDFFLRFRSDLALTGTPKMSTRDSDRLFVSPTDFHTLLDLALTSASSQEEDATSQQFLDSRKSFRGSMSMDWRLFKRLESALGDGVRNGFALGPSAFYSVQSFREDVAPEAVNSTTENVTRAWGAGMRVMQFSFDAKKSNANPLPRHFLGIYYGDDQAIGNNRVFVESALLLDRAYGLFIGFEANLGPGEDDLRVMVGLTTTLEQITGAINQIIGKRDS